MLAFAEQSSALEGTFGDSPIFRPILPMSFVPR